jgi:hypothetical protein
VNSGKSICPAVGHQQTRWKSMSRWEKFIVKIPLLVALHPFRSGIVEIFRCGLRCERLPVIAPQLCCDLTN